MGDIKRGFSAKDAAVTRWRDAHSLPKPKRPPRQIEPGTPLLVVELRRKGMLQVRISRRIDVSAPTISRALAWVGLCGGCLSCCR